MLFLLRHYQILNIWNIDYNKLSDEIKPLAKLHLSERLMFSTVRIESTKQSEKGKQHSYGTGFIFDFFRTPKGNLPVIVSIRHVVEDSIEGRFLFNRADIDGRPVFGQPVSCDFKEFEQDWIFHPDANVDLAIMPIGRLFENFFHMQQQQFRLFN
jgi:hypothetical protein